MWRRILLLAVVAAAGCSGGGFETEPGPTNAILYTVGASTQPYGRPAAPRGFGIVSRIGSEDSETVEVHGRGLGSFAGATWIDDRRILVPRGAPPFRAPWIYRFDERRVERIGPSPLPPLHTKQAWSPDGRLIASEPIAPCKPSQKALWECYRQPGRVFVQRADGSGRRRVVTGGHFNGWTPDGGLLVTDLNFHAPYEVLDVRSGERTLPLSAARVAALAGRRRVHLDAPRWSADGRYLAAIVTGNWPAGAHVSMGIVIAAADGRPLRLVTSPYVIPMFAWSPRGHRLAWTTSGFPDPHELFVLDEPAADPVRRFVTRARHFDWFTWSPDARWILVDDASADAWRLLRSSGQGHVRTLPRLGGLPLWCCPVNAYALREG